MQAGFENSPAWRILGTSYRQAHGERSVNKIAAVGDSRASNDGSEQHELSEPTALTTCINDVAV